MKVTLWFLILFGLDVVYSQRFNPEASSCQETVLTARMGWRVFTSPNYPGKFAKQTQCNWVIRAEIGYRIELKFDAFYLLGSPATNKGCHIQHLSIRDMLSGITDGRYCGNTLPPSMVSTGGKLRITLESNAVRLLKTSYYHGFRAEFRASRQPSSLRLRDDSGRWRSYRVTGGDVIITTTTPTPTIPTRNPNEVDDNNNAAIDNLNNQRNNQNVNNNDIVNKQNNEFNHPPESLTLPPRRFVPRPTTPAKEKRRRNPAIFSRPLPPRDVIIPQQLPPPERPGNSVLIHQTGDEEENKPNNSSSVLIGGAIGGVLAIILIVAVVLYFLRKRQKKEKKSKKPNNKRSGSRPIRHRQQHEAHRLKHLSQSKQRQSSMPGKHTNLPGRPDQHEIDFWRLFHSSCDRHSYHSQSQL